MTIKEKLSSHFSTLEEFRSLTEELLTYLSHVSNLTDPECIKSGPYLLPVVSSWSSTHRLRPVNSSLFITDKNEFLVAFSKVAVFLAACKEEKKSVILANTEAFNKAIYTIQQSIGLGFDALGETNSARKHVWTRFEELISALFSKAWVVCWKKVLQISYEGENGLDTYKCENDLVLTPFNSIRSTDEMLHPKEVVVSIKTTSKDRMWKIFVDKMLLQKLGWGERVIWIFLNDVQRKEDNGVSYTLVSGVFKVYTEKLTSLDGVYYVDLPPVAKKDAYKNLIKPLSELFASDLRLLNISA